MCEYCEKDKRKKRTMMLNTPTIATKMKNNQNLEYLSIKHYNSKAVIIEDVIIINYCPICGRKLEEN